MMPRAKKSFSQNWLVDETVVKKIIDAAQIQPGETVLEIGPGTGVLTQALVDAKARVTAIEADLSLISSLRARFGKKIELVEGNVLDWRFQKKDEMRRAGGEQLPKRTKTYVEGVRAEAQADRFFPGSPYKLIANIPYNITSNLLRHFLTTSPKPSCMVLMVQKEVADRITAKPPQMSLLSVVCQMYAQCRRIANVPAGAFRPIPKVDSAIVKLDIMNTNVRWGIEPEEVIAVAKLGFSFPRKQLHGNLKSFRKLGSAMVKETLASLSIPTTARAEQLTVDDWVKLTHILKKKR
jgi:16S rRNA (adenine1518-N6/adenine1519-N6)-dimethyltransferase